MSNKAYSITSLPNPRFILDFLFPASLLSRPSWAHRIVVGLSDVTIAKGVNPISPLLRVDEVRRTRSLGGSRHAGRGPNPKTNPLTTFLRAFQPSFYWHSLFFQSTQHTPPHQLVQLTFSQYQLTTFNYHRS